MKRHFTWIVVLTAALAAAEDKPAPVAAPKPAAPVKKATAPSQSIVDTVITLANGGMSEASVIKWLQKQNKPVNPTAAEMVKLQKAGISENIINVMMDPSAAPAAPSPAPVPAPEAAAPAPAPAAAAPVAESAPHAGQATPFPPAVRQCSYWTAKAQTGGESI